MTPLLEQFLSEAREFLQGISDKLMQLETAPDDAGLMIELFRLVHTLKGNSGLFDFPDMTRVLHAGEDLMDAVRNGRVTYSRLLADRLLEAMDFVALLCEEIESSGNTNLDASHASTAVTLVKGLRALLDAADGQTVASAAAPSTATDHAAPQIQSLAHLPLASIPEAARMAAYQRAKDGALLHWLDYRPDEQCFYQGDDPFFLARQTPDLLWGGIKAQGDWPPLPELDAYSCRLDFRLLTAAARSALDEHYRYVPDQITLTPIPRMVLALPQGDTNGGPVYDDFIVDAHQLLAAGDLAGLARNASTMLELSSPDLWIASALRWLRLVLDRDPENHVALGALIDSLSTLSAPDWDAIAVAESASIQPLHPDQEQSAATLAAGQSGATGGRYRLQIEEAVALTAIVATQRQILALPDAPAWFPGRIKAVATVLAGCLRVVGVTEDDADLESAVAQALADQNGAALLIWLEDWLPLDELVANAAETERDVVAAEATTAVPSAPKLASPQAASALAGAAPGAKFGRRAEDALTGPKSLKVDQIKIDRLMNLIGEMVVAKNALPYLAGRAEMVFGVRELSRDIKGHYAVINRIAEDMQHAIMQVRMMPVSFVFQRFPRLVRDISRKLDKEVNLVLIGEDTEADKNIIEALADPLIHIVRNSLDHGIEVPEVRRQTGKPPAGTLTIRAMQEADRVVIEIEDDGKGIDPEIIKRKAYAKGMIDESVLERISDEEAVNLVFAAGFSTVEQISDLSGRGVGMDVVRNAVEQVNGTFGLTSELGRGTRLRLSLPLSMAVTNVMIVVTDGQQFGIPMDSVVETVRVRRSAIRTIKRSLTTVLRGRIVPLKLMNTLLGIDAEPQASGDDELAVLVVRLGNEVVGLVVDDFRESLDIILKPMSGVMNGLSAYAGSALMGDGSVLMVLNIRGML